MSTDSYKAENSATAPDNTSGESFKMGQETEEVTRKEMPPDQVDTLVDPAGSSEMAPPAVVNDTKVKFSRGGSSNDNEVRLDLEKAGVIKVKIPEEEFQAMTKAELMEYAKDPFWVMLRWALFVLFWVAWVAMLIGAVVIIIYAPKCPPPTPKQWWQRKPIYAVYTKSFKDSNGDSIGDLKGVTSKLDYLTQLGVGSVLLAPIYRSPMKDNGYDIQKYIDIDPIFGSIQDFKDLIAGLHERNIKLIMDFVPNHSSDQHEWFQKSIQKKDPYTDYYIWKAGSPTNPPTNWKSVFGDSAWTFNEERGEWYLHQFYKEQPDLNLKNEDVKRELKDIMNFWLGLGVDGFRIDSVAHFYEDDQFRDEAVVTGQSGYNSVSHEHTFNQPGNLELLREFRKVLDDKTKEDEYHPRIMMTEAYLTIEDLGNYYGNITEQIGSVSHMPINFNMIEKFQNAEDVTAENMYNTIKNYLDGLPIEKVDETENVLRKDSEDDPLARAWPNINTGNHDNSRMANRFGGVLDAVHMIVMLLQGTPITYYGDEIGMKDMVTGTSEPRDAYRTTMQWDSSKPSAGFSSNQGWLKVSPNFEEVNVASEMEAATSHLKIYQKLASFRDFEAVLYGDTELKMEGNFFGFSRIKKGNPGLLIAVNFGDEPVSVNLSKMKNVPQIGQLELASTNYQEAPEKTQNLEALKLRPKEGLVITFVPQF